MFLPLVKPGKLAEFQQVWKEWFVLTDLLKDEKCPGLLKEEFCTQDGEIIALAPKLYQVHCRKKGENFRIKILKRDWLIFINFFEE